MIKVLYVYRTSRRGLYKGWKQGNNPDHLLYGLNHIERMGFDVYFSDIAYSRLNLLYWFFYPIQKLIIKATSIGFKLDQALLLLPRIQKSDIVVTTVDSAGLPILLLKYLRVINKPIIYISTGLINEIVSRKSKVILFLYEKITSKADYIVCHSREEVKFYEQLSRKAKNNILFIPFGIDADFFKCRSERGDYVFSVGRDRSRDYNMLSKISKKFNKESFVLVTDKSSINELEFTNNVKILYNQPYHIVRNLYCNAKFIFLPLREINRAAGQISFLESVAMNKVILTASIKGLMDTYPKITRKYRNLFLYKERSFMSCKQLFTSVMNKKNYNYKFPSEYTSYEYSRKIASLIKSLI